MSREIPHRHLFIYCVWTFSVLHIRDTVHILVCCGNILVCRHLWDSKNPWQGICSLHLGILITWRWAWHAVGIHIVEGICWISIRFLNRYNWIKEAKMSAWSEFLSLLDNRPNSLNVVFQGLKNSSISSASEILNFISSSICLCTYTHW